MAAPGGQRGFHHGIEYVFENGVYRCLGCCLQLPNHPGYYNDCPAHTRIKDEGAIMHGENMLEEVNPMDFAERQLDEAVTRIQQIDAETQQLSKERLEAVEEAERARETLLRKVEEASALINFTSKASKGL